MSKKQTPQEARQAAAERRITREASRKANALSMRALNEQVGSSMFPDLLEGLTEDTAVEIAQEEAAKSARRRVPREIAIECRCAGPLFDPNKPCPVHRDGYELPVEDKRRNGAKDKGIKDKGSQQKSIQRRGSKHPLDLHRSPSGVAAEGLQRAGRTTQAEQRRRLLEGEDARESSTRLERQKKKIRKKAPNQLPSAKRGEK